MIFHELSLGGVYRIEPEAVSDDRGRFARTWCTREFATEGIEFLPVQSNLSYNRRRGTLRGIHYQRAPHEEAKLIRCTRGSAWIVVVDLRTGSPTHGRHLGVAIDAEEAHEVFVPQGTANGFQTLADDTEILYLMGHPYAADAATGYRWDDPDLGVEWPLVPTVISARDRQLPLFRERAT